MSNWVDIKATSITPSKRGEYLVYHPERIAMDRDDLGPKISILHYTGKRWISSFPVSHWMPLPAAPEGK